MLFRSRTGSGFDTTYTATASPKGSRKINPDYATKLHNLDELIAVEFARGGTAKALSKLAPVLGLKDEGYVVGGSSASTPALEFKDDAIEDYADFEEVDASIVDEIEAEEAAPAKAPPKAAAAKATPAAKAAPKAAAAKAAPAPAEASDEEDFDKLLAELDEMEG